MGPVLAPLPTRSHSSAAIGESVASVRPRADLFWVAAAFALLSGLGELVLLGARKFVLHETIRMGPQILWLTPTADLLLFLLVAVALAPFVRRGRALASPRALAAIFSFLAVLGILLVERWSYRFGFTVLALGAAAEIGRQAARAPDRFRRLVRRLPPALAAIVVLLGGGYNVVAYARERSFLAGLPAARAGAPNVLLLIWDTVRARDLSLYGFELPTTPRLQDFARGGVVFDQAIATAPWTLPSHAGMFTGRYPHELSVGWRRPLDGHWPTLAEVLARHGYTTGGFVGNTIYAGYEFGLQRGFGRYEDYVVSPGQLFLASSLLRAGSNNPVLRLFLHSDRIIGRKSAADVSHEFLSWLDRRPRGRPFFAFLNDFDAHEPYTAPAPFDSRFGAAPRLRHWYVSYNTNSAEHGKRWTMSPAEVRAEEGAYDASIAYLDAQFGNLIEQLRARRLLDNTIVIVAADHGEEFGQHGVFEHGNSLYLPVLHVPLVMVWPRAIPAATRVAAHVSLSEIPATVLDLLGIQGGPFPGASLARTWTPRSPRGPAAEVLSEVGAQRAAPAWYPVHAGDMQGIIQDGFHLIRRGDGREELYALASDPLERHDLARDPAYRSQLLRLAAALPPARVPRSP